MPEKVAVTFQIFSLQVESDDLVSAALEPIHVIRHFPLTNEVSHFAGNDEFPNFFAFSDKNLVGGKDHVLEFLNGGNGFHEDSCVFEGSAKVLPLLLRQHTIDRIAHVYVLDFADVEKCRGTHQGSSRHAGR